MEYACGLAARIIACAHRHGTIAMLAGQDRTMFEVCRPEACPGCGCARILRIFYGSPQPEAFAAVHRGEAVLGGCFVRANQPDWHCSRCEHRWFDPEDPTRQRIDAVIERLTSGASAPPIPELTVRRDGLLERLWLVKMKGRASLGGEDFSSELRDRARREYKQCLVDQAFGHVDDDETVLDVRADVVGPRSYKVAVARGGAAPNWVMAADTWVMHAVEILVGPIAAWENTPRERWKLWPLPPPDAVDKKDAG
jgi:hypothetical protein